MDERRKPKARHTFAAVAAVGVIGILIWIIELARRGDPVGYIILTGTGMMIFLVVIGLVLRLVITATNQSSRQPNNLKTMYDTQNCWPCKIDL